MKLLLIIVYWLHIVSCRPKALKGDASDIMFLYNVVKEKRDLLLHAPSISAKARSWFDRERRSSEEPIIGIIVENYSKYQLQDPQHQRLKTKISPVEPGSTEFFDGEKEGDHGDLRGGVSWQINRASGDRDRRTTRLFVKFHVKSR